MEIIARAEGKSLYVSFPFELKDAFKEMFKTAKWNADRRKWVIGNTKANLNKIDLFKQKTEQAIAALQSLEDQEATDEELAKLEAKVAEIEAQTLLAIKSKEESVSKLERINQLKAKIDAANPELNKARQEAEEADAAVKQIIQGLVRKHDIDSIIGKLIYNRKQFTVSERRKEFGGLQVELLEIRDKILTQTGIRLSTLQKLYDEDYRNTTPQALFLIARDLQSKYEIVDADE
ncbi:hypothetical protein [Pseudomonas monteilii]|uniref:hypothetical protein n=1 Tax=Pseudomonas monteilii TaxID=76759 RepID=UPI001F1919F2|nr:hypothetical protein [Pseudomonas monteilii]